MRRCLGDISLRQCTKSTISHLFIFVTQLDTLHVTYKCKVVTWAAWRGHCFFFPQLFEYYHYFNSSLSSIGQCFTAAGIIHKSLIHYFLESTQQNISFTVHQCRCENVSFLQTKPNFHNFQSFRLLCSAILYHTNMQSRETAEICDSLPSALFNTHGIRRTESSSAAGIPTLAEGLVLKPAPRVARDLPPPWRPRCSVPRELPEVSAEGRKHVGHKRKLKSWSSHG